MNEERTKEIAKYLFLDGRTYQLVIEPLVDLNCNYIDVNKAIEQARQELINSNNSLRYVREKTLDEVIGFLKMKAQIFRVLGVEYLIEELTQLKGAS